jgi:hypothetical protein
VIEDHDAIVAAGRATLEEIAATAQFAIERTVSVVKDRTGVVLLVRKPEILDATMTDLISMETQAAHFTTAMVLIRQWILPSEYVRLGDRLKIVPAGVAEAIEQHLRAAGVLPP